MLFLWFEDERKKKLLPIAEISNLFSIEHTRVHGDRLIQPSRFESIIVYASIDVLSRNGGVFFLLRFQLLQLTL